jgi:hypothetical protein
LVELVLEHQNGEEHLSENTLVVVIDDTGQEEFRDPNFPVFGIGGCAFLVRDYQRLIELPWNYMCEKFFPSFERPLHASKLGKLSEEQLGALKNFFEKFEFFRIATVVSVESVKEIDANYIDIVGSTFLNRILEIAQWIEFERIYIIFEASDRIGSKVIKSLSGKNIIREDSGVKIPIELGLMPKSACEPALEVADFIVHTAGAQTKHRTSGNTQDRQDFKIIFNNVDKRLTSFMYITRIEKK